MIPLAAMHQDIPRPPAVPASKGDGRSPATGAPTVRQRLLERLARWLESGRNPALLPQDWEYLVQSCWVFDHGEDHDLPPEAHEYIIAAGDACGPVNYDILLREQGWCGVCGDSFLFEHLAICADCFETRCRTCLDQAQGPRESLDSRTHHAVKCTCGGDFVG